MTPAPSGAREAAGGGLDRLGAVPYARLSGYAPVSWQRSACLRARLHVSTCRACVDACPVHALSIGTDGIALARAGCTGCGRCQAVCPMSAIAVDGFERLAAELSDENGQPVLVDCMHGDPSDVTAPEIRVPCLGGLSVGSLLALCARFPQRAIDVADRGECATCDSGGGTEHPAARTLHRVAELMSAVGVPRERLPRFASPAAATRGQAPSADPLQSRGRSRRGFFTALARPASASRPSSRSLAATAPSTARRSTLDALESLAARYGGQVPASLFHRVEISPACRGDRVCASACPTGALVRYRDDVAGRMGVAFDSRACIGCGHCAAVCPEQALRLHHGGGDPTGAHLPLTRFEQRHCTDCGARFALKPSESAARCDRCRKSAQLAHAAFTSLFAARP